MQRTGTAGLIRRVLVVDNNLAGTPNAAARSVHALESELRARTIEVVEAGSKPDGVIWRYTTDRPAEGWMKPSFNDRSWKEGPGGFGTEARTIGGSGPIGQVSCSVTRVFRSSICPSK